MYLVHFYGLTALYPWVAEARDWINVVTHLVFGLAAAWSYQHLQSELKNEK